MARSDSNTAFEEAAEAFDDASDQVETVRGKLNHLRGVKDDGDAWLKEREREVGASPAVQEAPAEGGPHNVETRLARTVGILGSDEPYLKQRTATGDARDEMANADVDLERWRDRRSLARRRMDFEIALATPDDEGKRSDSHA